VVISLPDVLRSLLVPRRAALESLALLALAAPLPVAAGLTGGAGVAILTFLGVITGISTKAFLPPVQALVLCAGTAVLVAAATAVYGRAGWVGLIVAAAAVLGGEANRQSSGVLSIAPAMAAIGGMAPLHATWFAAGGWVLAGAAYAVLVVALLRIKVTPKPVDPATVWIHTAVLTVLCGTAAVAAVAWRVPHGYWLILTFVSVLRPSWSESVSRSRNRLIGTLAGALLCLAIVALLPSAAALVTALASLYLFVCYMLAGRYAPAVVFLTTTTILLTSGGAPAAAVRLDEYRIAWTFAAIVIAAAVGAAIIYADHRRLAVKARRSAAAS
jgi:uncharacterized membrane protein YccC